jgi:general secretion pathway protein G
MSLRAWRPRGGQSGLTLIEMVATVVILLCVTSVALPLSVNAVRRGKELRLRRALNSMRAAIDEYNKYAKANAIQAWDPDWEMYPKDLDMLVEGVEVTMPNSPTPKTVQFLRQIPVDPMTGQATWGTRSYQDDPGETSTGGENLYDVYSLSMATALDGSLYSEW